MLWGYIVGALVIFQRSYRFCCRSPGFGLTLVAETLEGCFLSAEMSSTPQGQGEPVVPEDLGRNCAKLLLEEVYRVSAVKFGFVFKKNV